MDLSVFQVVTVLAVIRLCRDADQDCLWFEMRLSWPQHLQVSRTLEIAGEAERGTALALMGISLLILLEDLSNLDPPFTPNRHDA